MIDGTLSNYYPDTEFGTEHCITGNYPTTPAKHRIDAHDDHRISTLHPCLRCRTDQNVQVERLSAGLRDHSDRARNGRACAQISSDRARLVSAGYTVYANDHRGHGEFAAQANVLGDFGPGGFPVLVDDMARVTQAARDADKGKPLVLGHSMGSFAAQLYLLDHSELLDGVALSGTTALDLLGAAAMAGRWKIEALTASFTPARSRFDWLSDDKAVFAAYRA